MEIRSGEERDLEALNEVYNHYVKTSPATFDIGEVSMEAHRAWFGALGGPHRLFVALDGDRFLGYAYSGSISPRRAYDASVSTSVYLEPSAHRKGIGTALYEVLFVALEDEGLHRAYAGITVPNPASFALHEKFGFKQVGYYTEQGRKFGKYWDVAWLEKAL
jgi:phosphinothricin acetyltransferase